ncbi:hypothetical protein C7271_07420 [filamentous cyanobacterium CCP5]|nr:hypothetical protein C7271_07420 [filamentous cyanobacterium CCP5]
MSPGPRPDSDAAPSRRRSWLIKVGAGVAGVVVVGAVAGALVAKPLINRRIMPLVEEQVEDRIGRPIALGNVEGLSLGGIVIGPTELPPTADDASFATVETMEIGVDWVALALDRTLKPTITLIDPELTLVEEEEAGQWLDLVLPERPEEEGPISTEIQAITIRNATLNARTEGAYEAAVTERSPLLVEDIDFEASVHDADAERFDFELSGDIGNGDFRLMGEGQLADRDIKAMVMAHQLPVQSLNLVLPETLGIASGSLSSQLDLEVNLQETPESLEDLDNLQAVAQGVVQFENGEFVAAQLPESISDINSTLRFQGRRVTLENTGVALGDIALTAAGTVDLDEGYALEAAISRITLENIEALAEVELPVTAAGAFEFDSQVTGELTDPRIIGAIRNLNSVRVDQLDIETIRANFALTQNAFTLEQLRVIPATGGYLTAQGQVGLADLTNPAVNLTLETDLPGDELAALYDVTLPNGAAIGSVVASGQVDGTLDNLQGQVQWQLAESTYPGSGTITLNGTTLVLNNTEFQVESGTLTATAQANLDVGSWQANVTTRQLPLNRFTDQAQGLLRADIQAAGNLNNLDPAAIQLGGTATVSDGNLRLVNGQELLRPGNWQTAFQWIGDGVRVDRFTAPGLRADGFIAASLTPTPAIGAIDLNVNLDEYDLAPLVALAPEQVQEQLAVAGLVSFDGQVRGTLENPELMGEAQVDRLGINDLQFAEVLTGPVRYGLSSGGRIALTGNNSRISARLPADTVFPSEFVVRNEDFRIEGEIIDRQLVATVEDFSLGSLGVNPAAIASLDANLGLVTGTVNGDLTADLSDLSQIEATGSLAIESLALGELTARVLNAEFSYADGTATLATGELRLGESRYLLNGQVDLSDFAFEANLDIAPGRAQDLVTVLEWADRVGIGRTVETNYPQGTAAEVQPASVGLPEASLLAQIETFAAFMNRQRLEAETGTAQLPPLDTLEGEFTGTIQAQGTGLSADAITAEVKLSGSGWTWGPYAPDNQFIVQGRYADQILTLEPVAIQVDESTISLVGQGSPDNLDGQLTVNQVPVEVAQAFVDLPVAVDGNLSLVAKLGGSLANPLVEGEAMVSDPSFNQQALETVALDFEYRNAHLRFDGRAAADNQRQLTLVGDIPYALPIMTLQPETDQIDVRVAIADSHLELINWVTDDQVRWEGGSGKVLVVARGTLEDPEIVGNATFRDGVLAVEGLSQPLTNINGKALFDLDQVQVEQISADYGEGKILVDGGLPLQNPQPESEAGLMVALDQVPVDYDGLLQATFDGQVRITGAALNPVVGGAMRVGEGIVRPNQLLREFSSLPNPSEIAEEPAGNSYREAFLGEEATIDAIETAQTPSLLSKVQLDQFTVVLSDRLQIAGQPFYNITASGDITVNGTLADLRPDGVIALETGWINLFSQQFRLSGSAPNTVAFSPERGLEPFFDLRLKTRVQDTNITRVPESANGFASAEVTDNTDLAAIGQVEYLEVDAVAYGPLSEVEDSLALTSDPPRDQSELLALMGSGLAGGITGASVTSLTGFIGSGTLATIGNDIASAVGLRSFSVFPTTDTATDSSAGIGIGVEASFDIGRSIGVNLLEVLNNGNPPQVGLEYRLSRELRLRGSTNLSGDNEVRLEYRTRF